MGDVARWATAAFRRSNEENLVGNEEESQLMRLLTSLEEAYGNEGPEIEELISVSFLENLPRPEEEGGQIRALVGPRLKKQLNAIG